MIVSACVRFFTKTDSKMYDIPCHRHADAFYIISQFVSMKDIDREKTQQGFMTHDDEFLNRNEAMQHAIACGQFFPDIDNRCKELYSEDLW